MLIKGTMRVADMDADVRPNDWAEAVLRYFPNEAGLQALLPRMKREKASDAVFSQFELDYWPLQARLNMPGDAAADVTILTVDDGSGTSGIAKYFQEGTLIRAGSSLHTGEVLRVKEVISDTQIEVSRGYGGTTAATIANDALLTNIGQASAEKDASPTSRARTPSKVVNYCQIFQTPYDSTRLAESTQVRGESVPTGARKDALLQHAEEREMAFLYGIKAYEDDAAGRGVRYSTGGLTTFVTTHLHDGSGVNFSRTNIRAWLTAMLGDGNAEKISWMGKTALAKFYEFIRATSAYQITAETTTFGFKVLRFLSEGATLLIANHPLMNKIDPGGIIIADLEFLALKIMGGFDMKNEAVTLDNTPQVNKRQLYSIAGLKCLRESAHAYWYGITAYTDA